MALTKRQSESKLKQRLKTLKKAGWTDDELASFERGWRQVDKYTEKKK